MYKIIFVDIDGTLRNSKKETTERTKRAIKALVEKGIHVVISSGRYRKYTENVSTEAFASSYIISSNGGEIFDYKNKEIIYENNLDPQTIIYLYNIAKKYKLQFVMNSRDNRVANYPSNNEDIMLEQPIEEFVRNNTSVQCVFVGKDLEKIKKAKCEVEKKNGLKIINLSKALLQENIQTEVSLFFDVALENTSKGNAIKRLCKYLKIDLKDSVAIGDSYNDLSMFKVVRT